MATYTTYDQVGKAEDVSSIITDISPTDCPLYSTIRSEKVSARVFEWQEDSLAAAANNAQLKEQILRWQRSRRPPFALIIAKS